jgi:alkyl hydroperoxide reductase subunit F
MGVSGFALPRRLLAGLVAHVTLVEFDTQLRADAVLQRKLNSLANVNVIVNAQTTSITGDDKVNGLTDKDRATGEEKRVDLEGVFVQIGLVSNTEWLKGAVELSKHGEIIIAAGDGAKAALGAFNHLIRSSAPA